MDPRLDPFAFVARIESAVPIRVQSLHGVRVGKAERYTAAGMVFAGQDIPDLRVMKCQAGIGVTVRGPTPLLPDRQRFLSAMADDLARKVHVVTRSLLRPARLDHYRVRSVGVDTFGL